MPKSLYRAVNYLLSIIAFPRMPTNRELIHAKALSMLGVDASPKDQAPDELACMESVDNIHFRVFGDHICVNYLSTYWAFKAFLERPDFEQIPLEDALPGDIIISPTQGSIVGHVGILGEGGIIMSNNSFADTNGVRGIFEENYTLASWRRAFVMRKGLGMYAFRKK